MKEYKAPFLKAMSEYVERKMTPFDVPGHHLSGEKNPFSSLVGESVFAADMNAPYGLDNLSNPHGVLREAEELFAKMAHADYSFFSVNGTTGGILSIFLTALKAGDKIILPRNIHKSVINALILCGAVPVYIMPSLDNNLEIANQPPLEAYKKAILRHPSAKAVFVINPTYFGDVAPLKEIVEFAHLHHMAVLTDEAHGAHYYFHAEGAPLSAMDAGADLSCLSLHKTGGSLTQSSVILLKEGIFHKEDVQKGLNIVTTTSPSSLLLGSIDGARAFMESEEGKKALEDTYALARYAEEEIEKIPGFCPETKKRYLEKGSFNYDETKLLIGLDGLDLTGFELYRLLNTNYGIQMELAETYALLGILSIGSKKEHVDRLIAALKDISRTHYKGEMNYPVHHFDSGFPFMLIRPRSAFQATGRVEKLEELDGEISKEQVMMYPPGIPLISPGEVWTKELILKVKRLQENGVTLMKNYPDGFEVIDKEAWKRYSLVERKLEDYMENRKTVPYADGYSLPFEGDEHECTFMLMPFRADTWREKGEPAQKNYLEVADAIAEHEKVVMGVHPAIYKRVAPLFNGHKNIDVISIRYNDAWARDSLPLFVTNGKQIRSVDFRFNAWGGDYDGLYSNYRDDDRISYLISRRLKMLSYYHPTFVLEGGSIAVDGEGTLICTEACLLSKGRNPSLRRVEIEEILREYLGVEKIVWVPHGIYEDETDEHIDNMVAFVKPGEVVMAWTEDTSDPQYEFCRMTYDALKEQKDAKGRSFKIHKLLVPQPPLFIKEEEARGVTCTRTTMDKRLAGRRLAASYVNFYQGKDFVILPAFHVAEDAKAYEIMKSLFPNKKIHQIYSREILLGGGNIHCITMQMPKRKGGF